MVSTLVSSLVLAWAIAPQITMSLQAVADDLAVETAPSEAAEILEEVVRPQLDTPVAEDVVEDVAEQAAPPVTETEATEPDQLDPIDTVEETTVEAAEITEPADENLDVVEVAPLNPGQVPEDEWAPILESVSAALTDAKTAKGQFIQTNIDGSISTGSFALNRPGRVRFEYDDPTPVLIVSDGTTVAIEDKDLETVDRVPIGSTPLGLILSPRLDVNDDVEILSVSQNTDRIGVRVSDATGELEGTLTMVFDKTSYELLGWLAVDGNLQTTVVDLVNIETNVRVDPRLFRLNEDDDEDDER